jgi:hypothetical protein
MVYFQTKNSDLDKFGRPNFPRLENVDILYGHVEYFITIGT